MLHLLRQEASVLQRLVCLVQNIHGRIAGKTPPALRRLPPSPDKERFVCSLAHGYSLCISASLQNQSKADMSQDSMLYFEPYLCSPYLVTFRSADGNA